MTDSVVWRCFTPGARVCVAERSPMVKARAPLDLERVCLALVQAVLEVLRHQRAPSQLPGLATVKARSGIQQMAQLCPADWQIVRVRIQAQTDDTAFGCAVIRMQETNYAIALEISRHGGRWLCTDWHFVVPNRLVRVRSVRGRP